MLDLVRRSAGGASVSALAADLGVHANTVRFHLAALAADGLVEMAPDDGADGAARARQRPGRPSVRFRSVPRMDPSGPRHYLELAGALAAALAAEPDAASRALRTGQEWGRGLVGAASDSSDIPDSDPGGDPGGGSGGVSAVDRLVGLLTDLGFDPELEPAADDTSGNGRVALRHCPFLEVATHRPEVVCPLHLGLMRGALQQLGAPVGVDRLEPFAQPDRCIAHLVVAR